MSKSALDFLTAQILLDYAGSRSFKLGQEYFDSKSVYDLEEYEGRVVAKVSGTHDYKVKLWADDESLEYDCSCPYAGEGNFCKHCVAAGLAWIDENKDKKNKKSGEKKSTPLDDVKNYLLLQEKAALVELLMKEVLDNETLRGQLVLAAARRRPQGIDVKIYRRELERVFGSYEENYGKYGRGIDHSEDLEKAVESLDGLFEDGHFETVIDLCEYALKLASEAMTYVPEVDAALEDARENLQSLHLSACEKANPDVDELARRLFEFELNDEWETFNNSIIDYADVLGEKGIAFYKHLLEKRWAEIPALKPGDKGSYSENRYRITRMMESLAFAEDNIEKVVEIKTRDLSSQYTYYLIAEIYREAKQYDKALEWAERGIGDFPAAEKIDGRLSLFLASEYHRRGRHEDAMNISWREFEETSGFSDYCKLKEQVDKIKPESDWKIWREKALNLIRRKIAERKSKSTGSRHLYPTDNSLLVQILLSENLPEEAWNEASAGGCSEDLWLKLAEIREKKHPADALKIYRDRIEPKLGESGNQAYEQAVFWLKKVKKLMAVLDREAEFNDYLAALRATYKAKRNFIKLLDSTKW